jgi:PAS domain S-box-containing protein
VKFYRSTVSRYGFALAAVALATALRYALFFAHLRDRPGFRLIFLAAIMAAAWQGYGPGILATVISVAGLPFLFLRGYTLARMDIVNLVLILLIALLISRLASTRARTEATLRKSNEELDDRVRKRTAELVQANAEAHSRLAEVDHLYATAAVGLAFVDTRLRYVRVNELLARINGVPAAAHIGRSIRETLPPGLAGLVEPMYRQVIDTGEPLLDREIHSTSPAQPGVERDWLVSYSPVKTADGVLLGVQALVQDITHRKQFEDQLRQTQKLESLGVLAGGIAHDFNNLLVGILGNSSLALDSLEPDHAIRPLLEEVTIASHRAARLTSQMLAYSGKGRFMVQVVDVRELIRETLPLIQAAVPRTVELQLQVTEPCPPVEIDVAQIQQLVMNLVINAAESIPKEQPGVVTIGASQIIVDESYLRSAGAAQELEVGPYARIEVRDTGSGMDEQTKARIFDPFFTTKFTGRGLGLAAALGIVRGHRGLIQVDSAPGQGSAFRILLPAAAKAPKVIAPDDHKAVRADGAGAVLVVDDEPIVQQVARQTLRRAGYEVLLAGNGQTALEIFRKRAEEIRVVLLDMTMPVMSGEQTLVELKKIDPEVRVVLSSGFNEVEAIRRFEGRGLAGFIQKPYTAAALAEKIAAVQLDRHSSTAAD